MQVHRARTRLPAGTPGAPIRPGSLAEGAQNTRIAIKITRTTIAMTYNLFLFISRSSAAGRSNHSRKTAPPMWRFLCKGFPQTVLVGAEVHWDAAWLWRLDDRRSLPYEDEIGSVRGARCRRTRDL